MFKIEKEYDFDYKYNYKRNIEDEEKNIIKIIDIDAFKELNTFIYNIDEETKKEIVEKLLNERKLRTLKELNRYKHLIDEETRNNIKESIEEEMKITTIEYIENKLNEYIKDILFKSTFFNEIMIDIIKEKTKKLLRIDEEKERKGHEHIYYQIKYLANPFNDKIKRRKIISVGG